MFINTLILINPEAKLKQNPTQGKGPGNEVEQNLLKILSRRYLEITKSW